MNTPEIRKNYKELGYMLANKIEWAIKTQGLFPTLGSEKIWNSPIELGEYIARAVLWKEWDMVEDSVDDPIDVCQAKSDIRFSLISTAAHLLCRSREQSIITQLRVKQTLANKLPPSDQDRLIASALMISHTKWLQLRGVLSALNIPKNTGLLGIPKMCIANDGERYCNLQFPLGADIGDLSIPGLTVRRGDGVSIRGVDMNFISSPPRKMLSLGVSERTMSRYDAVLPEPNKEQYSRERMMNAYGGLTVWKKRGFGGDKQIEKEVPEGKLA